MNTTFKSWFVLVLLAGLFHSLSGKSANNPKKLTQTNCQKPSFKYTVTGITQVVLSNTAVVNEATVVINAGNYMAVGQLVSDVSTTNLRFIEDIQSNGNVIFEGRHVFTPRNTLDLSSSYFNQLYGPYTLVNPNVTGTLSETLTPYVDLNNNRQYDSAIECLGQPTVLNYRITPVITFRFSATGSTIAELSNVISLDSDTVTLCVGGGMAISALVSNVPKRTLRFIEATTSNGNVAFIGHPVPENRTPLDLDSTYFGRIYGQYTLLNPSLTGTLSETFTPYVDKNGNHQYDAATEELGRAVVLNYRIESSARQATIQNGSWTASAVWSCGHAPTTLDAVLIRHSVTLPTQYIARARQVSYESGGRLHYNLTSQLKVYTLP
ncbi:hypothetical protein ACAW74_21280 [Fibrella sp. WM1]|uniref:hypothetical protein n=1 Tax=Fibrella musci TaxID=3242485 RepID=UPI00351FC795